MPGIEEIKVSGDIRAFYMRGFGQIKEKILKLDQGNMCLQYSVISSPRTPEFHLATMNIVGTGAKSHSSGKLQKEFNNEMEEHGYENCSLIWTTEIKPEKYAAGIAEAMDASIKLLEGIVEKEQEKMPWKER